MKVLVMTILIADLIFCLIVLKPMILETVILKKSIMKLRQENAKLIRVMERPLSLQKSLMQMVM